MPFLKGFIDRDGEPRLRIVLIGDHGRGELEPLVDTGFTEFLLIPAQEARRLGIRAYGRATLVLADGKATSVVTGLGRVELSDSEIHRGIVLFGAGGDSLLGMEFLRQTRKALYVDRRSVLLIDEANVDELQRRLSLVD
jgi:clan AA aspartic protease